MNLLEVFVCMMPLAMFFTVFFIAFGVAYATSIKHRVYIVLGSLTALAVEFWLFTTLLN